jgi:TonB family protein
MKSKTFKILIFLAISPFLFGERRNINVNFRLYRALSSEDTYVHVRWVPKKIESADLTYFFTANIESHETPEEKEIKSIFKIKELELVKEGEFVISFDPEFYRGKTGSYMVGYWEGYFGARGPHLETTLSNGKKYHFRLIPAEPKVDTKRFRFQIYEPPYREWKENFKGAITPEKFYVDVEFLLQDKTSTVIGFVDSKDVAYFAVFKFSEPKERIVGGVVGGIITPEKIPEKKLEEQKKPIPLKEGLLPPRLIKKVEPIYPENCVKNEIEGIVILEATTDEKGNVVDAKVLRSAHPELDKSAIEAVKQWKYAPYILDGEPRSIVFTVTVTFKLAKEPEEFVSIVYGAYPPECPKVKGIVEIKAKLNKKGELENINISKSLDPCLDKHAIEKVKKWLKTEEGRKIIEKRTHLPSTILILVQFME